MPNDIIYCDPPYDGTSKYNNNSEFNHIEFWEWVKNCKNPVYVSEYQAPDFMIKIGTIKKRVTLSGLNKSLTKMENIYWNGVGDNFTGGLF